MSAITAVERDGAGALGVMVRTATTLYVYWEGETSPQVLRVVDVTGRPPAELLDGTGCREITVPPGCRSYYVSDLLPGHLYYVAAGRSGPDGFRPARAVGPVQTPWLDTAGESAFPAPYHRS
jgi:hypothetical protein